MTDFGGELHRILAGRGISLSAAAREAGCSKGYLSNAANGRKPLTPRVAAGLDRLFGMDGTFAAHALTPPPGSSGGKRLLSAAGVGEAEFRAPHVLRASLLRPARRHGRTGEQRRCHRSWPRP